MTIRSFRERILQTTCFEIVGIAAISPLYAAFVGRSMAQGVALIALLSAVILIWSPIYNTLFDLAERRCAGRTACERPQTMRLVHAILHEVSAVLLTCPILVVIGEHSVLDALAINLGLTLVYTAYTYVFHLVYHHLRPVRSAARAARTCPAARLLAFKSPASAR